MNFARWDVISSLTKSKLCWSCSEYAQAQITNTNAKNNATPVTRCRIDAMAGAGNDMVERSRFTGLCFFTVLAHRCPLSSSCCHCRCHCCINSQHPKPIHLFAQAGSVLPDSKSACWVNCLKTAIVYISEFAITIFVWFYSKKSVFGTLHILLFRAIILESNTYWAKTH